MSTSARPKRVGWRRAGSLGQGKGSGLGSSRVAGVKDLRV